MFDATEEPLRPWAICHADCRRGPVDAASASLISRSVPFLPLHLGSLAGLVFGPTTDIACAFPADAGTLGHVNGRCTGADRASVGATRDSGGARLGVGAAYRGATLRDALGQQYDGSWRRSHFRASEYNEIVISSMAWERCLPRCLEAFLVVATGARAGSGSSAATDREEPQGGEARPPRPLGDHVGDTTMDATRRMRDAFLEIYGLRPTEVPLLRYVCSQSGETR